MPRSVAAAGLPSPTAANFELRQAERVDLNLRLARGTGGTMKLGNIMFVCTYQWIGLRENLQETIDFPIKYGVFL